MTEFHDDLDAGEEEGRPPRSAQNSGAPFSLKPGHLHSRSLVYFDAIRKSGSIRAAARVLHVSSSSVNRQLLALEDELGAPLFERLTSGLRLTTMGEILARHVINVFQDMQRLVGEVNAVRGIRHGEISIVSVEGLMTNFVPTLLSKIKKRYPSLGIKVRAAGSAEVARIVAQGECDLGLAFEQLYSPELNQFAVAKLTIGAVVAAKHPLVALQEVTFTDCSRHPLIFSTPDVSIHSILQPLVRRTKKPYVTLLETNSVELMKNMSMSGSGVAFQVRMGVEREVARGELAFLPLKAPGGHIYGELGAYVRAGRTYPPALDALIQAVREELEAAVQRDRGGTNSPS